MFSAALAAVESFHLPAGAARKPRAEAVRGVRTRGGEAGTIAVLPKVIGGVCEVQGAMSGLTLNTLFYMRSAILDETIRPSD